MHLLIELQTTRLIGVGTIRAEGVIHLVEVIYILLYMASLACQKTTPYFLTTRSEIHDFGSG